MKISLSLALLLTASTAFGQFFRHNPITTNTPAGMTNVVVAIARTPTNVIDFASGANWKGTLQGTNGAAGISNVLSAAGWSSQSGIATNGGIRTSGAIQGPAGGLLIGNGSGASIVFDTGDIRPTGGVHDLGRATIPFGTLYATEASSRGVVRGTNGIASYSSVASVAITETGWTNIWSTNNAVIVYGGTTVSSWKKRAGALTSTNITYPVFSGNNTVILQPGQAVVISGTGVTGSADPF